MIDVDSKLPVVQISGRVIKDNGKGKDETLEILKIAQVIKRSEDKNQNLTQNDMIMYFSFFIEAMELVFSIFIFSYFCAIFWYLGCEMILDFVNDRSLDITA